jgi:hypothetical protein
MPNPVDPESQKRLERVIKLLQARGTGDYEQVAMQLREARELFHEEIARSVQKSLNEHLSNMPQKTLKEKQELAKWLNAECRFLGVAVKDPSGQAAFLRANPRFKDKEGTGRFQVCVLEGQAVRATATSKELVALEFVGNADRGGRLRERMKWQDRIVDADRRISTDSQKKR